MPAGDADRIRDYATRLVEDARRVGEARIKFRAGDIREALQIRNYSSVCQALDGPSFHKQAGVELLAYSGVPSRAGANAYFEFEILASSNLQREGVPNDSLEETPLISNQDLNEDFDRPEIEDLPTTPFVNDGEAGITSSLLERILKLSPDEFENLVGGYLEAKGFLDVEVTGKSYDGGIDGHCGIPFINVKVAFQAKRYATGNNVGIEPVQRLQGSMSNTYDRGVFITTSSFTSAAKGWVDEAQAQIILIDGDELVKQMMELGLGIKVIPVVKYEVDEGFFADLENKQ